MRILARLKKIEEKVSEGSQNWAIFCIADYADSEERELAQQRLINAYVNQGNPYPTHRIFIREIPSPGSPCKERFLSSFRCKAT